MSENESPYQNEWNRWDLNELKWIERFEVKWVIWRIWLCEPYGKVPMSWERVSLSKWLEWSQWESPYELRMSVPIKMTWVIPMRMFLSKWSESMRFEWIEVNRTIRGKMSDLKDLTLWTLWEWSYGLEKVSLWKWLEMNPMRKSLSKWSELKCIEWI